jgi:hypothetical protein
MFPLYRYNLSQVIDSLMCTHAVKYSRLTEAVYSIRSAHNQVHKATYSFDSDCESQPGGTSKLDLVSFVSL